MADSADLSAVAAAAAIRRGELSSEALTSACLARIRAREPVVRAFVDLKPDLALAQARACDGRRPGADQPLFGVPVAVKEVFDLAGYHCGWGTPIHAGRVPDQDAAAVARVKAAGAVILGTTVSTEYAIAAAGPTTNPHAASRTPGGSSSGSAAAVAAGMVPLALGSQSIGSIVRPATYCGVLGLKPSYGAISTLGGMPLAAELDHVGVLAREVADIALACGVLFGPDARNPDSRVVAAPDLRYASPPGRVLHVVGPFAQRVRAASEEAVAAAVERFGRAGLAVTRVELPAKFEQLESVIFTLLCRGIARHHGADFDRAADAMSARLRELVIRGRAIGDEAHARARALAGEFTGELARLLPPGTVAVSAAVDDVAPPREKGTGSPLLQGLWTVAGFPALSVPCTRVDGLPIGVQLAAGAGQEAALLLAADRLLAMS